MSRSARLKPRRIGSGKRGAYLLEFEARSGRVGVAMNDPHQIRLVRLREPARYLYRDPLASPPRKPVHIADQGNHAASPPPPLAAARYALERASGTRCQIACRHPKRG